MLEKSIKPQLDGQLEARPIAMLVQVASQYDSTVYLETEGRKVNAKSIMGYDEPCRKHWNRNQDYYRRIR